MELLQLKYFCQAAQAESFTRAARDFQVPPSDISQCIKRLERELNAQLFDRRANRVVLNERGKVFYQKARQALELLEEAKNELADSAAGEGIYLSVQTNRRIVMQAVRSFCRLYPRINVVTSHAVCSDPHRYHLIIADDTLPGEALQRQKLLTEDVYLAVSKSSPLLRDGRVALDELHNQSFVSMGPGSSMYQIMQELCARLGFVPRVAIQSDDPYYIRRCVEMDLGVSVVPSVSWKGQFPENIHLQRLDGVVRNTYAYWSDKKELSASVKTFLQMLVSAFQAECDGDGDGNAEEGTREA